MKNEKCKCGCSRGKKTVAFVGGIAIAVALAFGACKWSCCGTKTMVIDFDRVRQEAEAYRSILDAQRGYEEKLQAQLSLDAGEMQKKEKELADKKGKLSETEFKKKALALQKEALELQKKYQLQAQKILIASQIVAEKLQPAVEETLQNVAKKSGAGVVVNKAVTVYANDKVDMTDAFIKALNENVKAETYPNPDTIQPTVGGQ